MNLGINFSEVEATSGDTSPLPKGNYHAEITAIQTKYSDNHPSKAGQELRTAAGDKFITVELTIRQPQEYAGRKLWENQNMWRKDPSNPSQLAQSANIARQIFKRMSLAAGVPEGMIGDSGATVGRMVAIAVDDSTIYNGEIQNNVKNYKPISAVAPHIIGFTHKQGAQQTQRGQSASGGVPPRPNTNAIPPRPNAANQQNAQPAPVNTDPFDTQDLDDDVPF